MKRVIIVQARLGSRRLPGKVLEPVLGQPMVTRQLERLKRCQQVDAIVLATTDRAQDDALVEIGRAAEIPVFRGSEEDVLSRYLGAARAYQAELVVRITADCPLIDPEVIDRVIAVATSPHDRCDYASNTMTRTYPRGLDVEVFHVDVLERMARLATSQPAREHVTYFIEREHPELFVTRGEIDTKNNADLRWTVDTADDLRLIREIYARAELDRKWLSYPELVALVRSDPRLITLNQHVAQQQD